MSSKHPIVTTKLGALRGKMDSAINGRAYYTFHGIPFAEPPVENLRFKAPQPAQPWSGILDATIEGDECYSKHQFYFKTVGSEDCLTLNVYTPSISKNVKQPVMVWVYGGGFTTGASKVEAYGPDFFMCEDIVLVTMNYRLGIFGFLSLNDQSLRVPGNAGLKDQVMALRWVQENIDCFGGDANNVTLFGESAGSVSVNYLLCSPMAKGLFHKVIMQSGSALNPWARGTALSNDLVNYFKMGGKSEAEILSVLMAASKEELLIAQNKCRESSTGFNPRPFAPVIEGYNPYEPSLVVEDPLNVMKAGNYIQVPMIIGYNTCEGMFFDVISNKLKVDLLPNDLEYAVPSKYGARKGSEALKTLGNQIKTFYCGTNDPRSETSRIYLRNMQTDAVFLRGIYEGLRIMLKSSKHPIYFYRFAFDGELNLYKKLFQITDKGVCHGEDVFYMFKTMVTPDIQPNSREDITLKRFIKFWTNFARNSNPNPLQSDDLLNVNWRPSDGNTVLNIEDDLKMIDFPEMDRMLFWDKLDTIGQNKL